MNFFEKQRIAKKNSNTILGYFCVSVILLVLAMDYVVLALYSYISESESFYNHQIFVITSLITSFIIVLGIIYKRLTLSSGTSIMEVHMVGRLIPTDTDDLDQRIVLNVVEELSVASGIPTPPVYVLPNDNSINAFVAGYTIQDTAIALTHGAVTHLDRDELQAVLAHEYSHIFNGDMSTNTKLIGVLFGITMISDLGGFLARSGNNRAGRLSLGTWYLTVLGIAILIVGSVGAFFAKLIKSSFSKERELLADATSVQFTRNGVALTSALKKVLVGEDFLFSYNSRLESVSHMCFADVHGAWGTSFDTHPPVIERIKAVEKGFSFKQFSKSEADQLEKSMREIDLSNQQRNIHPKYRDSIELELIRTNRQLRQDTASVLSGMEVLALANRKTKIKQNIGAVNDESVGYSKQLLSEIPRVIKNSLYTTETAKEVIFSIFREESNIPVVRDHRIPIIDLSIRALRRMGKSEKEDFFKQLKRLIKADGKYSLQEFIYYALLDKYLANNNKRQKLNLSTLVGKRDDCIYVLSLLAQVGNRSDEIRKMAFESGVSKYFGNSVDMISKEKLSISSFEKSLKSLERLNLESKESFIDACITVINYDDEVLNKEFETLRGITALLDVPMPLILK